MVAYMKFQVPPRFEGESEQGRTGQSIPSGDDPRTEREPRTTRRNAPTADGTWVRAVPVARRSRIVDRCRSERDPGPVHRHLAVDANVDVAP
jgi:hypothetical protein